MATAPELRRNLSLDEALSDARQTFASKRPRSREAFDTALKVMPGGNTRTILFHGPFPFRAARGEGSRIIDVDGHSYVNLQGEFSAGIYGHTHPIIRAAVIEALDHGLNLGSHNALEMELARIITGRFPSITHIRFTNSGTEANLMAMTAARAFTKRSKIMVFKGGYHGGVFVFAKGLSSYNAPFPYVLATYNDTEGTRRLIREHGTDLAAVFVELMQGAGGNIPGEPDFLAMLSEETKKAGVLLAFDEVVTSRISSGGAQKLLGLTPDLTTLGKYMGGGMSFGAFGGRADVMAIFDPRRPDSISHSGTFNQNVVSMAAGIAGLTKIYTAEAADALSKKGEALKARMNKLFADQGVGMQALGLASLICMHPTTKRIRNIDDLAHCDPKLRELLFLDLVEQGYYIAQRGSFALSLAVSDKEIDGFVTALGEVIAARRGLLPPRSA